MNEMSSIWLTASVALGSSLITIIITKIIDSFQEKKRFEREIFKLIFERKTNVVENAMGWYQDALDNYRLLQMACDAYQDDTEDFALTRLYSAFKQSDKLFKESSARLNPIYLYYDFSEVEQRNKSVESAEKMNENMNNMAALVTKIQSSKSDSEISMSSRRKLKELLLSLSNNFSNQINTIVEIQSILRNDYKI